MVERRTGGDQSNSGVVLGSCASLALSSMCLGSCNWGYSAETVCDGRLRPGGFLVIGGKDFATGPSLLSAEIRREDHLPNGFCEKNCLIEVDYRAEEIGLGDVRCQPPPPSPRERCQMFLTPFIERCIFQKSGGAALNSKAADRRGRAPNPSSKMSPDLRSSRKTLPLPSKRC